MNTNFQEQLVDCEIQVSQLSAQLLAQDSHILSLETQLQSLKLQLTITKDSSTICTQTSFDTLLLDSCSQTPISTKSDKSVQTDSAINKNFLLSDEISTTKKLLMAYEEVNKENTVQEDPEDSDSKSEDYERICGKAKESFVKPLSFISALNLKSDLPVKETCPKSIKGSARRRHSQDSCV